jgi:integrase
MILFNLHVSADLIRHVQSRRAEGAAPATVINDLIWIGVVLRAAKSVKELPVVPEIVQQARSACRELRLVGKPKKRTRRPTADELTQLREHFKSRDRRAEIPMLAVMEFAIASARRESEICRLEWRDNDKAARTGLVRDAKHPTGKNGNHRRFKYTPEAWEIASAQPETSERIFYADVPGKERTWVGAVPVTSTRRTLVDCAHSSVTPDLLRQAATQALTRGLVTKPELKEVEKALKPYGGIKG